ncbi:MAG TPA: aspartate/glutamate racemase family protein [Cyclobacteriaceae bacterium]|jgi:aspartate racemase
MKTLGIIGGLSWFSTTVYYKTINQLTNERLGGSHSARLLLYSVDFNDFKVLQEKNDWGKIEHMLTDIALRLQSAGADCIVMATNTPHLVADIVRQKIKIPLLHIAEETAKEIIRQKINKVGLLGTKFTMENAFFKDRLTKFGINTVIPDSSDRDFIHATIFNEFTKGIFKDETKKKYIDIIAKLKRDGAEGVIFGCTEIGLLITQDDSNITVFDTTAIHSKAAVDFALSTELVTE